MADGPDAACGGQRLASRNSYLVVHDADAARLVLHSSMCIQCAELQQSVQSTYELFYTICG